MTFDWHRRHPADMIAVRKMMTHGDYGIYTDLLDHLYLYNPLPDEDKQMAGMLGVQKQRPFLHLLEAS